MSNVRLYQGNCVDILKEMPDASIDLVLTDPPYDNDNHGGGRTELAQRQLVKDLHIDFMSNSFDCKSILPELVRVCRIPNIIMFCSNKQVSTIMGFFERIGLSVTLLIWQKTNPIPLCNGKYISDLEYIVYAHGKGATFNNDCPFEWKKKLYSSPVVPKENRLHPAQKPIALLKRYIQLHANENEVVFDPFMGSGSTGVAAKALERNFVGIELDENYFRIAKERIESDEVLSEITTTDVVDMKTNKLF